MLELIRYTNSPASMENPESSGDQLFDLLRQRLGDRQGDFILPPPVFHTMQGKILAFDPEAGTLSSRFPILPGYLNPYGSMQGGFVAAAVDNTLGPLSMLVAPPNVTRRLEIKYSQAVTPDLMYILVEGKYLGIEGQYLKFNADVRAPAGNLLARARSYHWVTSQ